jgi:NADPH:quinone reductase-like Zn-dependent oxidoreductase
MKAVVIRAPGGVDQLEYRELPDPCPEPGEVVVRLRAAALNHLDIWVRQGGADSPPCFPHVCGSDGAGEVVAVGEGVSERAVGTRVVIDPWIACGACAACRAGERHRCPELRTIGAQTPGTYSELVRVPAGNVLSIPGDLAEPAAAAVPFVFATAWQMLIERARLRPGETCLVLAAGSGVGSAAIQVARLAGARVIATASLRSKLQRARELGADETINYLQRDFAAEARALTGGRGVDVVFEHVGPATFGQSLRALGVGGRLVTCGATTGAAVAFDLRSFYRRQLSILGATGGSRRDLETVLRLVTEGRLRPVVDVLCDLKDAARAQERMLAREQFGKIVLTM